MTSWKVRNRVDDSWARKLGRSHLLTLLFIFIGWIPLLGVFIQRLIAHALWRKHYRMMLTSRDYFRRVFQAKMAEKVLCWHRAGRVNDKRALSVASVSWRYAGHWFLSLLPIGLHRLMTDRQYAKERLDYLFVRPIRLYFNPKLREQWLRDMVKEGCEKNILNTEDSGIILNQIKEPFIQKYLKSLAVHVCTLPVTQVVSVLLATGYIMMHPEMSRAQAWGVGIGIIALFQVVPISPGSLVRGLYVVYLVIKERNFKDYNIAVFLGFFKYVGYLAFPIQMAYRYPVLARFMAGHWANESVHIVPVFGESGALLEHWVFCLFYNWPLTIRRRVLKRLEKRAVTAKAFLACRFMRHCSGRNIRPDRIYFFKTGRRSSRFKRYWVALRSCLCELRRSRNNWLRRCVLVGTNCRGGCLGMLNRWILYNAVCNPCHGQRVVGGCDGSRQYLANVCLFDFCNNRGYYYRTETDGSGLKKNLISPNYT